MMFLLIIAILFFVYVFYIKYISVFLYETKETINDTVLEKKVEYIPQVIYNPNSPLIHEIYSKETFFIKTKEKNLFVSLTYNQYIKYNINSPLVIEKKERYYLKRSGFLFQNTDLFKEESFKILETHES